MFKKDIRSIFKKYWEGLNTRGYKEIDLLSKEVNGMLVLCHIGQWTEEKVKNTFDYDIIILDEEKNVVYDESNGELPKYKCYERFEEITGKERYEEE